MNLWAPCVERLLDIVRVAASAVPPSVHVDLEVEPDADGGRRLRRAPKGSRFLVSAAAAGSEGMRGACPRALVGET